MTSYKFMEGVIGRYPCSHSESYNPCILTDPIKPILSKVSEITEGVFEESELAEYNYIKALAMLFNAYHS